MVFIFLVIKPVNIYQALLHIPRRRKDERKDEWIYLLSTATGAGGVAAVYIYRW